jgi:hypothetical protein
MHSINALAVRFDRISGWAARFGVASESAWLGFGRAFQAVEGGRHRPTFWQPSIVHGDIVVCAASCTRIRAAAARIGAGRGFQTRPLQYVCSPLSPARPFLRAYAAPTHCLRFSASYGSHSLGRTRHLVVDWGIFGFRAIRGLECGIVHARVWSSKPPPGARLVDSL